MKKYLAKMISTNTIVPIISAKYFFIFSNDL